MSINIDILNLSSDGLIKQKDTCQYFFCNTVPDHTNSMSSNDLGKCVCFIKHPLSQQSFKIFGFPQIIQNITIGETTVKLFSFLCYVVISDPRHIECSNLTKA